MLKKILKVAAGVSVLGAVSLAFALPARYFEGKPNVKTGQENAAYVWHDNQGYHVLFTTKKGQPPRYLHGSVCTGGKYPIDWVKPVLLEKNESATRGPHKRCIFYKFTTFTHLDGFDFNTKASNLTFTFKYGANQRVPRNLIYIGQNRKNPVLWPFYRTP
jgi:hypothetical protein